MGVVKNIAVRAIADFSNLINASMSLQETMRRTSDNVSSSMQRMNRETKALDGIGAAFTGLKNHLLGLASVYIGVQGLKDATNAAMQYEAEMGNLTHILGNQTQAFVNWGNTQARTFGYGQSDVVKYGTQFANLVSTFTHGQAQIKQRTQELLQTTAIIANGTGRTIEDVMERMRSGLLGNVQAINDLGIYANNSMIQTSKAFKEIANGRTWNALTFQEQQQILYMSLMEQAATKFGTTMQQNTHLKVNQFLGVLKDLRVALGNVILPILNAVLPTLNAMGMALLRVMKIAAQFSQALFGKAVWKPDQPQKETQAIDKQTGSVNKLTKAVKGLKTAKEQSAVAGFDQVNTLNNNSTSGTGPDTGGGSALDLGTPDTSGIDNATNDIYTNVAKVSKSIQDFVNNVRDWLAPVGPYWDALTYAVKTLWDALVNLWNSDGVQALIGWLTNAAQWAIKGTLELVTTAVNLLSQGINAVADALNGDWSSAWNEVKTMMDNLYNQFGAFTPLVVTLAGALTAYLVITKGVPAIVEAWTAAQTLLDIALDANPVGLLSVAIGILIAAVVELIQHWDDITKAGSKIWTDIQAAWGDIGKWWTSNVNDKITVAWAGLKDLGSTLWGYITSGWGSIWTWTKDHIIGSTDGGGILGCLASISDLGARLWGYLTTGWGSFWTWTKDHIIGKSGGTGILGAISSISNIGKTIWGYITSGFGSVGSWFTKNLANPVTKAIGGIKNTIGNVLGGTISKVYNSIRGFWNGMIGKVSGWESPSILQSMGMSKYPMGFLNNAKLPALARGGITNGPMTALIGDNPGGREVVTPLNKLQDMMGSTVSNAILTAMQFQNANQGGNNTGRDVVLNVDGRTFARIVKPYLDMENKRVGTNIRLTTI